MNISLLFYSCRESIEPTPSIVRLRLGILSRLAEAVISTTEVKEDWGCSGIESKVYYLSNNLVVGERERSLIDLDP